MHHNPVLPESECKQLENKMSALESQVNVSPGGCEQTKRWMAPVHVFSIKGDTDDPIGGELIRHGCPWIFQHCESLQASVLYEASFRARHVRLLFVYTIARGFQE